MAASGCRRRVAAVLIGLVKMHAGGEFEYLRFRWAVPAYGLLIAGCGVIPTSGHPLEAGLSRKQVRTKVEPSQLVAEDQTRCTVDVNRFAKIKVGEGVWCLWVPASSVR